MAESESTDKLREDRAVILRRLADPSDDVYRYLYDPQCLARELGVADLIGEETIILLELRKRGEE